MAIVKMRKLNLIAISYDKDEILNALQRTNAAEITLHSDVEDTKTLEVKGEEGREYLSSVEAALDVLCNAVSLRLKEESVKKSDLLEDGFDVSYTDFMKSGAQKEEMDKLVAKINDLTKTKNLLKGELVKTLKEKNAANIYATIEQSLSVYGDTAHTYGRLGTVEVGAKEKLLSELSTLELCDVEMLTANAENVLFYVMAHKSVKAEVDGVLSSYAFVDCPYRDEKSGAETYREISDKVLALEGKLQANAEEIYALKEQIRPLKIYCDYLAFCLEKQEADGKLRATEKTFLLQAYVPATAEEAVKEELHSVSGAIYMEFSDPTETEEPPTLLKNNSIVSNFEGVTNTYSAPNYREFDPNTIMAFFYSLFMGFIIGDIGYGIVMFLGGGFLWWKNRARPTGMSKLAGSFAIGGIFAIFWGILFNSFFGFSLLPSTVMPNPQTDMWHLVGIAVPSVLVIAMLIGIGQLCVGYLCKAYQEFRRKNILDGIFSGLVWAVFSVGVALAIVGLLEEAKLPVLAKVGGLTAGGALLIAVLTAGRKEKFFGKFTKGFGAAYGVINYASDILSYARLYGLMLSGVVIAQIIAQYSVGFITGGNVLFIALGVLLLVVGNAFNLVMNLLGAYIHDARLQYVEFYGRFYEGNGELFKPLGSEHKYIYLLPAKAENAN